MDPYRLYTIGFGVKNDTELLFNLRKTKIMAEIGQEERKEKY